MQHLALLFTTWLVALEDFIPKPYITLTVELYRADA